MTTDKDLELVQQLIDATKEARVSWHPTATLNQFTTSFKGRFGVLIGKYDNGDCYFRVVDESGQEMLSIEGPPVGHLVDEMWELARRAALNVDQAIDDILQELKRG
jgi:hypothetical protein